MHHRRRGREGEADRLVGAGAAEIGDESDSARIVLVDDERRKRVGGCGVRDGTDLASGGRLEGRHARRADDELILYGLSEARSLDNCRVRIDNR
jgi:hypothetical protein